MLLYRYWLLLLAICSGIFAQSANVTLIANINNYPQLGYTDVWGYTAPNGEEYALLGVNAGVSIIRVTDPGNIAEVDFIPFVNYGWYDMKTYQTYMYVTSEGTTDMLIVDLSTLPDSASIVGMYSNYTTEPHNHFIDTETGVLYGIEDFNPANPVRLISLNDPVNPADLSVLGPGVGTDAHDVFAQDSILYVAEGGSPSLGFFDVSDPSNPSLLQRVFIPAAGYVHNVWVSEDKNYLASTEETPDKSVKMWDISDLNNVSLIGEYLGESRLAHNAFIRNNFVILSHYESGLKIVDISDPSDMVEVGFYDTYPQDDSPNFNGAWGVYPFTQNGMIFISDIQTGLYVVQFDTVRAGGLQGTITDAQTGIPVENVEVHFLEAHKTVSSDPNGNYALRTFEGNHTIVFSKLGYFPDTISVTLPAGASVTQNVSLNANLAAIGTSSDSIGAALPVNTTATMELVVSNVGPSGILDYVIDDVNGPVGMPNPAPRPNLTWSDFKFDVDVTGAARINHSGNAPRSAGVVGDTIIADPAGDLIFGSGGDAIHLFATNTGTAIIFELELLDPVNTDSLLGVLALDLDFDPATGAFPGGFGVNSPAQNIGSEIDILIDIPGVLLGTPFTMYIMEGSNSPGGGNLISSGPVMVNGNLFSFTVPLADINDDGNFNVAGLTGHFSPPQTLTSLDYLPDVGNGTVGVNPLGDLPWLSLSSDGGSLTAGESDTITVTFDSNGLEAGQVFSGVIMLLSNDPNATLVTIPVTLVTDPVGSIGHDPTLAGKFYLAQNYPNPFNPTTTIRYNLPKSATVSLKIFNALGQEIKTLVEGNQAAGEKTIAWDGKNNAGNPVSSGVYLYVLKSGSEVLSRKMLLLK